MNIILKKSFIVKVEGMIIMKGDELLDAHSASATNMSSGVSASVCSLVSVIPHYMN